MPCYHNEAGTIHVCVPSGERFVHTGICPDCGQWTRFLGHHYEWLGPEQTCLKCGRHWSDGEWMPLDFVPKSREKSIEAAKASWRRSIVLDKQEQK